MQWMRLIQSISLVGLHSRAEKNKQSSTGETTIAPTFSSSLCLLSLVWKYLQDGSHIPGWTQLISRAFDVLRAPLVPDTRIRSRPPRNAFIHASQTEPWVRGVRPYFTSPETPVSYCVSEGWAYQKASTDISSDISTIHLYFYSTAGPAHQ